MLNFFFLNKHFDRLKYIQSIYCLAKRFKNIYNQQLVHQQYFELLTCQFVLLDWNISSTDLNCQCKSILYDGVSDAKCALHGYTGDISKIYYNFLP